MTAEANGDPQHELASARACTGKALSVLATITIIGVVAMIESGFAAIDKIGGAEAARSLIDGMILGSNVWQYNPSLAPPYANSTLIMLSSSADLSRVLSVGRQED
jgi:hypothetical protein